MNNTVETNQVSDLDLESIFLGDGADQPALPDVLFECKNPHWSVSREGLKKILQIVLSFPSKLTVFMAIWREGDLIKFHANNRDALVQAHLPLLNDNAYVTDTDPPHKVYFVDTVKLLAFVNSYNQFALSFDPDGTIFYESPFVRYKLDTVKLNLNDVRIKFDRIDETKWYKFPLTKNEIGVLKNLYGFAVKLSDSKVLVDYEHSEAFYTLYKYHVCAGHEVTSGEKVIIRRLDLSTLKEIIEDNTKFAFTKDRVFFSFDLGVVSFLRVPYDEESFMYPDTFLTGKFLGKFDLDVSLIKRALKLSTLFNVEELVFDSVSNDVYMTVSEKARFKVGSIHPENESPLSFGMGSEIFSNLLSTVSGASLSVFVSEHGVQLACDDNRGVYSMSRASMGQLKQGKLPPVLSTPVSAPRETTPVEFQDSEVL